MKKKKREPLGTKIEILKINDTIIIFICLDNKLLPMLTQIKIYFMREIILNFSSLILLKSYRRPGVRSHYGVT